ncbi:hypothetical protein M2G88_21710, partial [Vibrio vulnificus]|nr:hypothetical protein [Vibrio vulnificus]
MKKQDAKKISSLLKASSAISQFEFPMLVGGVLAVIPGVIDEALVGAGAIAIYATIAIGRRYLIVNRDKYIRTLESARRSKKISKVEYQKAMRALNTLTVEGGTKK